MIDRSEFVIKKNLVSNDRDVPKMVAYLNYMNTEHFLGEGLAISDALLRHDGFDPPTYKRWMARLGLGEYVKGSHQIGKFNHNHGYCDKFIPSVKAWELHKRNQQSLNYESEIRFVRNSKKGLVDVTDAKVVLTHETPFNEEGVRELARTTTNKWLRNIAETLLRKSSNGILKTQYIRTKTNRFTAIGFSLQNCNRELKEVALKGCYSYDVSASQWNILDQNLVSKSPSITHMIENKAFMRKQIATELRTSISNAKTITTACLFGISMESLSDSGTPLKQSHYLLQLNQDLEEIATEIKSQASRSGYSHVSGIGSFGDTIDPEVWRRLGWGRKMLAYMLQNEEVKVLESLMEAFDDDIVFLHHDSITTTRKMDSDELSRVVFEKTGYRLKFEETIH